MARRAGQELQTRVRQQAAVAELGHRALAGVPLDELLAETARVAAAELGDVFVSILELTGDRRGLAIRAGYGLPEGAVGGVLDASEEALPGFALRGNEPVAVPDFAREDRFGASALVRDLDAASALAAPIGAAGAHFGVILVHSANPRRFSPDDANFLQSLANVAGAAVQRGRAEELVRDSEARFRELADTAPALMWMTDAEGQVTFVNEGWLRFTGTTLEEELGGGWSLGVHPDDAEGMLAGWTSALAARRPWEREYRLRRHDGEYRWIVNRGVPRFGEGEFLGYVGTATDIHERRVVEERLREVYERERRVAETLQRSLLPERLPRIEGVAMAARYLPAGKGAAIGGDWYDALELRDGRVALVVGDVVGHGLRAAARMGQLRNACRAYALVEPSPAKVLGRLNRLVSEDQEDAMATMLFLVLDRETGEVTFTNAGHPPPLVLGGGERPTFLDAGRSAPIGATEAAVFREGVAALRPGASLLLYTDGLVERRDVPLEHRLEQLAAAAAAAGEELEDLCDEVLSGVLAGEKPLDDVALLAVRPDPAGVERLALELPADPEALPMLRQRLRRFLHAAGASEDEAYEITLAISEAAGNAIEHAYGPGDEAFRVEVRLDGLDLVAAVSDRGRWRERRDEHRGRGLRIMRGLMDDATVRTEDDGTVVRMRRRLRAAIAA